MPDFEPIAETMRGRMRAHYAARGETLEDHGGQESLETNAGYVQRRAEALLRMLDGRCVRSLDGLDIVDLGCGYGALSLWFALHGARVVAIDQNAERLEVARAVADEHGLDVSFRNGRLEATGLDDCTFDLAVQNNSLCYIVARAARAAALAEARRILRPGGRFIGRNPNRWRPRDPFTGLPLVHLTPPDRAVALAGRLGRRRSRVRITSPLEAARELRRSGFEEVHQAWLSSPRRPDTLNLVSRYHNFTARRPAR